MRRRGHRLRVVLVAVLLATGVGAILKATDALPRVQLAALDTLFDVRGTQDPPADVVVVGIDDKTLEDSSFPLNRRRHARVIERLTDAGAAVIAMDIQFTEQSEFGAADTALIEAVRASRRVVLATTEVAPDGSTAIFGGGDGLEYSRAIPANGNVFADEDGVLRRARARAQGLETLAFAAVRKKTGRAPQLDGTALVDFPGPTGTIPQLSFRDVEYGSFDAEDVRGKIVVVGATSPQLQDLHRTPTDPELPGPEIQAATISTALAGFPLDEAPDWVDWLLIVALAAVAPLVGYRFGTPAGLLAGLVAAAAFAGGAILAFDEGVVVSVVPPLAAAFVGLVGTLLLANPVAHPRMNRFLDAITREGMNQRTRRLRAVMLLGTAAGVALLGLGFQALNILERAELSTVDQRFEIRGQRPPGPVVVVAIDDKTFDEVRNPQWPFRRTLHARVVDQLKKAGAKVIVYDVQFTEPSAFPAADEALIESVRAAGNVVMSTTEVADDGSTNIFGGGEVLAYSRAVPANGNVLKDVDGRLRRFQFRPQNLESLSVAALNVGSGRDVPTPEGDDAWNDYAGDRRSVPYLSFVDVARGAFRPEAVRDKYVVVGASAPSLQDLHSTSTTGSGLMPGPEVWAHAIATGLNGYRLEPVRWWIDALLLVLMAVAAPLAALRMRTGMALALAGVLLAAFLVAAQLAFNSEHAIVAVATPVLAAIVAIAATAAIHGLTVAYERANTRDAFARFVPESVVDQVLEDAEGVRLGGVRGEATVMFSDLRGFTSFAETLEPEQVIAALNRYLTAMSEAILDHGGTLVAYMGDGIMAVFGAPLKQEDDADRALAASRDMLERLHGFNASLRDEGLHEGFKMGIGLNSGPVMSGNVGSERRLEYTALGDTTNTAARLEGMTKGTPHQLFLADSTREALVEPVDDLIEVGEFEVRGRRAKIKLWSLSDEPDASVNGGEPAQAADARPV
jgi:adenylate cyclase